MIEVLRQYWDVIAGAIMAIVYIVRIEMRVNQVAAALQTHQTNQARIASEQHEKLKDMDETVRNECRALQEKLDHVIETCGVLVGKISVIERHVNGGEQ